MYFVTLNRKQNDWKLYKYDFATNRGELILTDSNNSWIDKKSFFSPSEDGAWASRRGFSFAIMESGELIWISEQDGFYHIYRNRPDGRPINQITRGDWEVNSINAIDSKNNTIYFSAKKETETESHLYSVKFNGSRLKRLTKEKGSHSTAFSPTLNYFINNYSSFTVPPKTFIKDNQPSIFCVVNLLSKIKIFIISINNLFFFNIFETYIF